MSDQRFIAHPIHMSRPPGEPRKLRRTEEDDFRRDLQRKLKERGWRICHFRDSRSVEGDRGLPDIIALREDARLLFIEVKAAKGRLSDEQRAWIHGLAFIAQQTRHLECYVWRPADAPMIERVIA